MYTGFFDIANSILQGILFIVTINYCVDKKNKKNKLQIFMWIILVSLSLIIATSVMGNYSLSVIVMHILTLVLLFIPYHKEKLTAAIGFSMVYFVIIVLSIISMTMLSWFTNIISIDIRYENIAIIALIYLPQYIFTYLFLRNMEFVYKIYLMIRSRVTFINTLIITTVIFDFLLSFSLIINDRDNPIFKEIIFVLLALCLIMATWHFANIDSKAKEIHRLNVELENKINELKKVKHDYGSQISYLYGAYLMKNYDRLGELFKSAIEGNNISTQVKALSNENSLISKIVYSIDLKDVDVLIDEKAELERTDINEMELQKVLSNIIRNSVEALKGKGLLMIRSFYNYNSVVISIQNNGPQIDKKLINKIFEQGVSTKENRDKDNGFGLYIVKEILNKYKGNVSVKSNPELTEFIVELPLCLNNI